MTSLGTASQSGEIVEKWIVDCSFLAKSAGWILGVGASKLQSILESNHDHVKRTDSGKINAKIFMIAMSRKLVMGPRNVWYGPGVRGGGWGWVQWSIGLSNLCNSCMQ